MPSKKSPTSRGFHSLTVSDDTYKAIVEHQKVYGTPTMAATVDRMTKPDSPATVASDGVKYTVDDIKLALRISGLTDRTINGVIASLESL